MILNMFCKDEPWEQICQTNPDECPHFNNNCSYGHTKKSDFIKVGHLSNLIGQFLSDTEQCKIIENQLDEANKNDKGNDILVINAASELEVDYDGIKMYIRISSLPTVTECRKCTGIFSPERK